MHPNEPQKSLKKNGLAIAAILFLFSMCFGFELRAQSSVVRYIDSDVGFALVDQVGTDIKDGDR
ncbi:MAG: hypothetical protein EOP14_06900, partial [Pseudomonas sp.]